MASFVKEKSFYKTLVSICIPIALQNLISFGVNLCDTLMVGTLGEAQLSGVSLGGQPNFIFMILCFGISSGACVLTAQYWEKEEPRAIAKILALAVRIALAIGIVLLLVVQLFPQQVMGLYTHDPDVIAEGVKYLRIQSVAYVFYCITCVTLTVLRSVETVSISVVIYGTSFVVNAIINYILIFGKFGAPQLGVQGAAIGTLCARMIECVMAVTFLLKFEKKIRFRISDLFSWDQALFSDYITHSVPVVINELMWGIGSSIQAAILGRLGASAVAANSICSVVQQLSMLFVAGMASASSVLVGKSIGAGDEKRARDSAFTLQIFYVIVGSCAALLMFSIRDFAVSFYNVPETTKELAKQCLIVSCFSVFFSSYWNPSMMGILRSGGDTRFVMVTDVIFMWMISIPFGALCGLLWHLPMPIVFLFLKMDEPLKSICAFIRLASGKWVRNVTREQAEEPVHP